MSRSNDPISSESCDAYIAELRGFSRSYRLQTGDPEDLTALCSKLRDSVLFREDFGSMIRSIAFRENLRISSDDLLRLVLLAWGGPGAGDGPSLSASDKDELARLVEAGKKPQSPDQASVPAGLKSQSAAGPEQHITGSEDRSASIIPVAKKERRIRMSAAMDKSGSGLNAALPSEDSSGQHVRLIPKIADQEAGATPSSGDAAGTNAFPPVTKEWEHKAAEQPESAFVTNRPHETVRDTGKPDPWAEGSALHLSLQEFARQSIADIDEAVSQGSLTRLEKRQLKARKASLRSFLGTTPATHK